MQSHIRRLKPPIRQDVVALGYVAADLAAVTHFRLHESEQDEVPYVFIVAVAVANPWRCSGGEVADSAVQHIFERAAVHFRALGHRQADVFANLHQRNAASRLLLQRHDFIEVKTSGDFAQFAVRPDW